MKKYELFIFFLLLLNVPFTNKCKGEGTTGAQFLNIGIGSRPCAMGEAYGAISNDPSAIYWNPAGLSQIQHLDFMFSQNFWLLDMNHQYAAGVVPTSIGSFGLGLCYSSSGNIPKIENFLNVGEYTAYDGSLSIAYARKLFGTFSLGFAGKYIFMKIENKRALAFAGDFGIIYDPEQIPELKFAFALQNMGSEIKFIDEGDPLPFNIKLSTAYITNTLTISVDLNRCDNNISYGFGTEYIIMKVMALRAGYNTTRSFSCGIGVNWNNIDLGYAFIPYKYIDYSHIISLRFHIK